MHELRELCCIYRHLSICPNLISKPKDKKTAKGKRGRSYERKTQNILAIRSQWRHKTSKLYLGSSSKPCKRTKIKVVYKRERQSEEEGKEENKRRTNKPFSSPCSVGKRPAALLFVKDSWIKELNWPHQLYVRSDPIELLAILLLPSPLWMISPFLPLPLASLLLRLVLFFCASNTATSVRNWARSRHCLYVGWGLQLTREEFLCKRWNPSP